MVVFYSIKLADSGLSKRIKEIIKSKSNYPMLIYDLERIVAAQHKCFINKMSNVYNIDIVMNDLLFMLKAYRHVNNICNILEMPFSKDCVDCRN
jgi:hypothetical protein